MKKLALLGTLDTKESEALYLKNQIESLDYKVIMIDISCHESHPLSLKPDFDQEYILKKGNITVERLNDMKRNSAVRVLSKIVGEILSSLQKSGKISGVVGYGGSVGSRLVYEAMKDLPFMFPKILVTTVSNIVSKYEGNKNILLFPSPVDFSGGKEINSFEKKILNSVVTLTISLIESNLLEKPDRPSVFLSQMGITTKCASLCYNIIEKRGYEPVSFHTAGQGGDTFEELIRAGAATGVLDITTSEVSNNYIGGVARTENKRLNGSIQRKVPCVICPGALDAVVFEGPGTKNVPLKFKHRQFFYHNPGITLMRINKYESAQIGEIFASRINKAKSPVKVVVPLRGWSEYDSPEGPKMIDYEEQLTNIKWYDNEADSWFAGSLKKQIDKNNPNVEIIEVENHINDPKFAETICKLIFESIEEYGSRII